MHKLIIKKRNLSKVVTIFILLGAVAYVSFRASRTIKIRSVLAATRTPYTVTYTEAGFRTTPDGVIADKTPVGSFKKIKARRSDGSLAQLTFEHNEALNGLAGQLASRKVMLVDKQQVVYLFPRSLTPSTLLMKPAEIAAAKSSPKDPTCRVHPERMGPWRVIAEGTFLGFKVVKHRSSQKESTADVEVWEAPQLDCEELYSKVLFKHGSNGEVTSITERTAVEVKVDEPKPELFNVSGYEMKPSDAYQAEVSALGYSADHIGQHLKEQLLRKDQAYEERRKQP